MDGETLQTFLDESEIMLHGVRGGILMFEQDPTSKSSLDIPMRRIGSLRELAADMGLPEIEQAAETLEKTIRSAMVDTGQVSDAQIRGILDQISEIESILATIRMGDDSFDDDLSMLAESSFDFLGKMEPASDSWQTEKDDEPSEQTEFEIDAELMEVFEMEADDLLKNIETNLEKLVARPDDKDALWEIRRNAHTFKGSAGIVGLKRQSELAHRVEDLLDRLVEADQGSNEQIIPLLLTANDCLKALAAGERSVTLTHTIDTLYADFDRVGAAIAEGPIALPPMAVAAPPAPEAVAEIAAVEALINNLIIAEKEEEKPQKIVETRSIVRVSLDKLDYLVGIIRDLVVSRSVFEQRLSEFDRQIDDLHNATRRLQSTNSRLEVDFEASMLETERPIGGPNVGTALPSREQFLDSEVDQFDSLEFDRYTEFHQTIRELSETSSDTFAINTSLESLKEDLESLFEQQRKLIDGIQEKVMRIRLVEFGTLKTRLDRAVRVTCDEEGKRAEVILENEHLEVDTQILDSMIEPLLHLLKNSVVHGIEYPEMRRLLGKPESGTIRVKLINEETHVILTVTDDGGGIATGALKEKAIISGVIARQAAEAMTDEQANELIFLPGLTTAQKLNLNAGRGVGMNIVKESIEAKKGTISMASTPHKGTTFTIRMPLPLAVTTALLVRSSNCVYAVPLKLVMQIVEVEPADVQAVASGLQFSFGQTNFSLKHIDELVGMPGRVDLSTPFTAFLIDTSTGAYAVAVDALVRSEEVVIKPLGKPLDSIGGLIGASILGNGQLVPILDVPFLVGRKTDQPAEAKPVVEQPKVMTVMVVDDSPSVRLMTSKVIKNAGWNVVTAKDGVDALEILAGSPTLPNVILSDIEMPRMGGYELVAAIKDDPRFKQLPVIMITSRAGEKHRTKAEEHGVDEYLIKPYSELELVQKIKGLTTQTSV